VNLLSDLRTQFDTSDEPSLVIFYLSSALRKHPYDALALGVSVALGTNWAAQLLPLFGRFGSPQWQGWSATFASVGQSNFAIVGALILILSSGKLAPGLAKILRLIVGVIEAIWMFASLAIYRWAALSSFSQPAMTVGLLHGLLVAALHALLFWWVTDPRTLRVKH
jgi:hypothetical protein